MTHQEHQVGHKKLRVAVLGGGPSHEHEVSLKSAENVARHLPKDRYEVREVTISKKGEWPVPLAELIRDTDIAFIALHGAYGEDGTVQAELDAAGVPYTGSGALASALAMNKFVSGQVLERNGIAIPLSLLVHVGEWERDPDLVLERIGRYIGYPVVTKPNASGSSVGVGIARDRDELVRGLLVVFAISRDALIQTFIEGREFTCGVLDDGIERSATALLPTEIVPQVSAFFDYRAKYEPGGSLEVTPANLPETTLAALRRTAVAAHRALGCRGISRTDFMLNGRGNLFVLEVNTIPGLTAESVIPKAAAATGLAFPDLLEMLIMCGLSDD
ncbi:MAG: D-alanine--D-alanine ligase family protein [bacterium]|nr:D-alanine--D-alanine ligase family protein [bacterium]